MSGIFECAVWQPYWLSILARGLRLESRVQNRDRQSTVCGMRAAINVYLRPAYMLIKILASAYALASSIWPRSC